MRRPSLLLTILAAKKDNDEKGVNVDDDDDDDDIDGDNEPTPCILSLVRLLIWVKALLAMLAAAAAMEALEGPERNESKPLDVNSEQKDTSRWVNFFAIGIDEANASSDTSVNSGRPDKLRERKFTQYEAIAMQVLSVKCLQSVKFNDCKFGHDLASRFNASSVNDLHPSSDSEWRKPPVNADRRSMTLGVMSRWKENKSTDCQIDPSRASSFQ